MSGGAAATVVLPDVGEERITAFEPRLAHTTLVHAAVVQLQLQLLMLWWPMMKLGSL